MVGLPATTAVNEAGPPRFLDFDDGRLVGLPIPASDRLQYVGCSPWKDERGRSHVVGRWMSISGQDETSILGDVGIARISFPDGQVIDRVSSQIVPVSPPCWSPNASPRVLFAAEDGRLYRMSFAGSSSSAAEPNSDDDLRSPRPIAWRGEPRETSRLTDPSWPVLPAFGGRLIASLSRRIEVPDKRSRRRIYYRPAELWCLSLSSDSSWIESASRLTPADADGLEERFAGLGRAFDGSIRLAYLTRRTGETFWRGRLATVSIDPNGGNPSVLADTIHDVVNNCLPIAPSFSTDGLHVDFARENDDGALLVKHVPLVSE